MARRPARKVETEDASTAAGRRLGRTGSGAHIAVLSAILLVAAGLRLIGVGAVGPPGLNQDEAANAWNAYCLLKTGQDQTGARRPIFYCPCLGGNRSTLYLYVLLPFQAVGGMNVMTTRLPGAIAGIVSVLLLHGVGRRLFGPGIGLLAAALLAVNPWHVQHSRWGHEACLGTLLALAPLAVLLWAGAPLADAVDLNRRRRVARMALAGLVVGVCCYGYQAVRIFLPVFLMGAVLVSGRGWWAYVRSARGALAVGAFLVAVGVTFGPLAAAHLGDRDGTGINKRARQTWAWEADDALNEKVGIIVRRYVRHFGWDFLAANGDRWPVHSVPGFGQFHVYALPLMVLGGLVVAWRLPSSPSARVLLVWVLAYPAGDVLSKHAEGSLHALRSYPGMCGLALLAAVGASSAVVWLWRRSRPAAITLCAVFGIAVMVCNARFYRTFFGEYNEHPKVYHFDFQVDIVEAFRWLEPHLDETDAVFCTTRGTNLPYVVSLVALNYDPEQWFQEPRAHETLYGFDLYSRYGKVHFLYEGSLGTAPREALDRLRNNGRPDSVVFIARPGEVTGQEPVHRIHGPGGVALCIYRVGL